MAQADRNFVAPWMFWCGGNLEGEPLPKRWPAPARPSMVRLPRARDPRTGRFTQHSQRGSGIRPRETSQHKLSKKPKKPD